MFDLFQELEHQEGKYVIVVTHSQEFAKESGRAVYLSKKKLVVNEIGNSKKAILILNWHNFQKYIDVNICYMIYLSKYYSCSFSDEPVR